MLAIEGHWEQSDNVASSVSYQPRNVVMQQLFARVTDCMVTSCVHGCSLSNAGPRLREPRSFCNRLHPSALDGQVWCSIHVMELKCRPVMIGSACGTNKLAQPEKQRCLTWNDSISGYC